MKRTMSLRVLPAAALLLLLVLLCPAALAGDSEKTIGHGEKVDIKAHLAEGKTTIVDFYSQFCPPCRRMSPLLTKLAEKRDDIFVLKVDINREGTQGIDWGSPVARQYELSSIPHFKIFGKDGKLEAEGQEAFNQILEMLSKEGIKQER